MQVGKTSISRWSLKSDQTAHSPIFFSNHYGHNINNFLLISCKVFGKHPPLTLNPFSRSNSASGKRKRSASRPRPSSWTGPCAAPGSSRPSRAGPRAPSTTPSPPRRMPPSGTRRGPSRRGRPPRRRSSTKPTVSRHVKVWREQDDFEAMQELAVREIGEKLATSLSGGCQNVCRGARGKGHLFKILNRQMNKPTTLNAHPTIPAAETTLRNDGANLIRQSRRIPSRTMYRFRCATGNNRQVHQVQRNPLCGCFTRAGVAVKKNLAGGFNGMFPFISRFWKRDVSKNLPAVVQVDLANGGLCWDVSMISISWRKKEVSRSLLIVLQVVLVTHIL